jgi:glycosyltransferase involved in cell wall biosynthesis
MKIHDFDIVYGLRQEQHRALFDKITSLGFNYVLNKLTGQNIPLNVATIRMMNRRFVNSYNLLNEKSRYLPGLESWMGFKHGYVDTIHRDRAQGKSSYNLKKRLAMAVDSIISFSDLPLKIVALIGLFFAFLGFVLLIVLVIQRLFFVDFLPGFASTISIMVFIGGIQIMVIGLASLYIGRILKEVQGRPLYLIREIYSRQQNMNRSAPPSEDHVNLARSVAQ